MTGIARGAEGRPLGHLALLVGDVVAQLDTPSALPRAVAECTVAIEGCLEDHRHERDAERSLDTVRDELRRLVRLLGLVEAADAPIVMRMIRRVLGRLDLRA